MDELQFNVRVVVVQDIGILKSTDMFALWFVQMGIGVIILHKDVNFY